MEALATFTTSWPITQFVTVADSTCGKLVGDWASSSHTGYTVSSMTTDGTVQIKIVGSDFDAIKEAMQQLQAAVVPTDAPPLTERQLDLFPAVLELDVTRDDILSGSRGNVHDCAVARALARRFDGAHVSVGGYEVRVWDPENGTTIVYRPTPELADFIRRFDHGSAVSSTRFHLERINEARGELFA